MWRPCARPLLELCAEPTGFEELAQARLRPLGPAAHDREQYVLVGSTLKSILAWHLDAGRAEALVGQNRLLWRRV